jgi:aldehyde:ferredoxin oxidoreductase
MKSKALVRINLSTHQVGIFDLPEDLRRLGGRGLGGALLLNEIDPACEPLSLENILIIAPGTLVGTIAPSATRVSVCGKSPLTGGIKESNAGGMAARALSSLGIAAIVLEGESSDWQILRITGNGMEFIPADDLVGLGNYRLHEKLREAYGPKASILSIGPAGERLLPVATVAINDIEGRPCRHAARGGLGAVMGAKRLKAIVIEPGEVRNTPADQEKFAQVSRAFARRVAEQRAIFTQLGTASLVEVINLVGGLPIENFSRGQSDKAEALTGKRLAELCRQRGGRTGHRCAPGCVIRCSNVFVDQEGQYVTSSLEYETIGLLGSNCGIFDLDAVAQMDRICDDYGIDTIEIGNALAVAMEGGLLKFGDIEEAKKLLHEVGRGGLLGRLLGQGALTTGKVLGVRRVPVVKGQGLAAYDPRALKGTGVTYATSPMGADHTAGNCLPGRGGVNIYEPHGQVELSRTLQIVTSICDTLGFCLFVGAVPENLGVFADLLGSYLGSPMDTEELVELGKQVLRTEVEFNRRAGITEAANRLPRFFTTEPLGERQLVFDVPVEDLQGFYRFLEG